MDVILAGFTLQVYKPGKGNKQVLSIKNKQHFGPISRYRSRSGVSSWTVLMDKNGKVVLSLDCFGGRETRVEHQQSIA